MLFTNREIQLIHHLLYRVAECMEKDVIDDKPVFVDGGNFVLCLEPSEMEELKKLLKKF